MERNQKIKWIEKELKMRIREILMDKKGWKENKNEQQMNWKVTGIF